MTRRPNRSPSSSRARVATDLRQQARLRALEGAVDRGRLAPSVHNTEPWTFALHPDRLELRIDPSRKLSALDPSGREMLQSTGAALLDVRAALAARGWSTRAGRLPRSDDPDLMAVVRPVPGEPGSSVSALDRAIPLRRTNRRPFDATTALADLLQAPAEAAAAEEAWLAPVRAPDELHQLASLTREADRIHDADPAYRAELAAWTNRRPADGDGIPCDVLPYAYGDRPDRLPLRNFHPRIDGLLPSHRRSRSERDILLLATENDDRRAWLRSGEAQALEVPATRARLRSLIGDAHPQMVLRIGRAAITPTAPRRPRRTVVLNRTRTPEPLRAGPAPGQPSASPPAQPGRRPVSDGRGGTTWI